MLAAEVAKSLHFSPHLVQLADRVVRNVTDGGRRGFNGLHLRIEGDVTAWIVKVGGIKVRMRLNRNARRDEGTGSIESLV